MKIEHKEFSFEESLKYLDELVAQYRESTETTVAHGLIEEDLYLKEVVQMNCTAMNIKIICKQFPQKKIAWYVYHATMSQILSILQSSKNIKHLDLQSDGGLLAMFDTPMKKDVEDIINLAAQIRSINDVVSRKFHIDAGKQVVSIGIDYGPITVFSDDGSISCAVCKGKPILVSKQLADSREDSVNISGDIYVNLQEDTRNKLFLNSAMIEDSKYYYSPLINLMMHKWVIEQDRG